MKASLKLTFSHRTRGPCEREEGKKFMLFKLQKKIQHIKHIWADTQYLYHDNKENLKAEFNMDIMAQGCFDTK